MNKLQIIVNDNSVYITLETGQKIELTLKGDTMQVYAAQLGNNLQITPMASNRIDIKSLTN